MWEVGVYIALSVAAFVLSISIAAAFFVFLWRRKKKNRELLCRGEKDLEMQQLSLSVRTASEKKVSFEGSPMDNALDGHVLPTTPRSNNNINVNVVEAYTVEDLRKATGDFSSANLIEDSVFHGRLNGKNLAIKCTKFGKSSQIKVELFHEAVHIHPNIIRLLGTCMTESESTQKSFLVFEYAKNGSLKDWIHGGLAMKSQFIASCYCFLTWNQRLRICLDVATALQYMHHIMNPSYVHLNVKSRNIFLDEEFNAKLGNFGMADYTKYDSYQDEESCSSNPSSWSKGYIAPEYLHSGISSPAVDIFAFGVVLLEVLSGQPPISGGKETGDQESVWLSEKVKVILESGNAREKLREWMDNVLGENYSLDAAVTVANLAKACVDDDPYFRPDAGEIVEKLSRLVAELPEAEQFTLCESSSKPLVPGQANSG